MGEVLLFRNGSYYKIKMNKNLFLLNRLEQIDGFISDVQEGYWYIPKSDYNRCLLKALLNESTQKNYLNDKHDLNLHHEGYSNTTNESPFSKKALTKLRLHCHLYKPRTPVNEEMKANHCKLGRSVQQVFEEASKNGSIIKKATVHTVRHYLAAHLLESGVDIRHVKELLGKSSIKSNKSFSRVDKRKDGMKL